MNEALRILDKILKKQGYAIKKHPEYNLLPIADNKDKDELIKAYDFFDANGIGDRNKFNRVEVCLRTCINNKRAMGKRSELTNVDLEEHLFRCIKSLATAVKFAADEGVDVSLTVFDDRSEGAVIEKIKQNFACLEDNWQFVTTEITGQGASLHEHFAYAKDKDALFYFCEDDYLHIPEAITEMLGFYNTIHQQTGKHCLIHPQEHELIYTQYNYPSYILLGENRRWRTMSHATHTFFIHSEMVDQYWDYFENTKYVGDREKRHLGSEKKTTDQLFKHVPGFSPIPAVAVHLQTRQCLPPFYDWRTLWDKQ